MTKVNKITTRKGICTKEENNIKTINIFQNLSKQNYFLEYLKTIYHLKLYSICIYLKCYVYK